jgi:aryl-alcohol dehydrogenase-like predicted oxidoreductase
VQQGKARYVGLSNFTPNEIQQCMTARRVDVLQYGYNLFDRRMAKWIFPYAREHSIGVMIYGSLAYGLMAGVFTEDTAFGNNDWRRGGGGNFSLRLFAPGVFKRNIQAVNEVKTIAERIGRKLPQLALNWVLSHPAVSTALVGARNIAEVEENMGAMDWNLGEEIRYEIDRIFAKYEIDVAPNKWVEGNLDIDIERQIREAG